MSFHLAGWQATIASTAETDLTPIQDVLVTIQNGHFLPQHNWLLRWFTYMSAVAGQVRVSTPTLRQTTTPRMHNLLRAVQPATFPQVYDRRSSPLLLSGLEEVAILVTNAANTSSVCSAFSGVDTGAWNPAPQGQYLGLRGTSTTAAVAGAWTPISMTWADSMPTGMYSIVGGVHASTNAQAFRCQFENQTDRPGGLSQVSEFLIQNPMFLDGGLGEWGRFHSYRMPNIEVLCNGTDNAHTVILDLVRIA